jgi:hypothetical protein
MRAVVHFRCDNSGESSGLERGALTKYRPRPHCVIDRPAGPVGKRAMTNSNDPAAANLARTARPSDDDTFHNEAEWVRTGFAQCNQPAPFNTPRAPASPQTSRFLVDWVDRNRETTHPADPAYPHGSAIDVALNAMKACRVELPYPAARCGLWVMTCRQCGFSIALATAGRPDDPRSVRIPCKLH